MQDGLSIGHGVLWVLVWFGFMLLYTALDVKVWRRVSPDYSGHLNVAAIALCMAVFLALLTRVTHFSVNFLGNVSPQGILLGIGCAVLFYFLLDKGLDPVFERLFPASEAHYQETLRSLSAAPVIGLLQIAVLAPIIEEILMRGFLLGGLSVRYGNGAALLVSSALFALLHFNMVQTVSAFVCGIMLGLVYLHTGSVFCCVLAHVGYNLISYITAISPPDNG